MPTAHHDFFMVLSYWWCGRGVVVAGYYHSGGVVGVGVEILTRHSIFANISNGRKAAKF